MQVRVGKETESVSSNNADPFLQLTYPMSRLNLSPGVVWKKAFMFPDKNVAKCNVDYLNLMRSIVSDSRLDNKSMDEVYKETFDVNPKFGNRVFQLLSFNWADNKEEESLLAKERGETINSLTKTSKTVVYSGQNIKTNRKCLPLIVFKNRAVVKSYIYGPGRRQKFGTMLTDC